MHIIKNIEIKCWKCLSSQSKQQTLQERGKIAETITVDDPIRLVTIYACS